MLQLPAHVTSLALAIAGLDPGPVEAHPLTPVVTGSLASTSPPAVQTTGPATLTTQAPQGASSSLLQPWGPVGDCDNSSHLAPSATRISAHVDGSEVTLSAKQHAACVSAVVSDTRLSSLIELSLKVRRLSGDQPGRICLWNFATRACQRLVPASDTPGQLDTGYLATKTDSTLHFLVPAQRYWLYLYADGSADGSTHEIETVRYDDVRVVPVSPWSFTALPAAVLSTHTPSVATATWANPARATLSVTRPAARQVVGLFESAAPGWHLSAGDAPTVPITIDGYRQGWLVGTRAGQGVATLSASYRPASIARAAIVVSLATLIVLVIAEIVTRRRRHRELASEDDADTRPRRRAAS